MDKVSGFCWLLWIKDHSCGLPKGFVTRVPCSCVHGAAVKCHQCFKANGIGVCWRENLIVYTELNASSPIWRTLVLLGKPHSLVSNPIHQVAATEQAQDCGQSVQHAASNLASNLASDSASPNQSVNPGTLHK